MDNLDGNLASLARQEKEWEITERQYEFFYEECNETIKPLLEEAHGLFIELCDRYNLDETFIDYIKEEF
jgi:hypothetical protein